MAEPAPARANINPNSHVRHHAVSPRPPAVARNRCSTADPPCYHMTRRDMTPDRHRFNAVYIVNLLQLCVFLDTRCAPPREPDQLPESNVLGPPEWLLHPQHRRIGQMQRSSGHGAQQRTADVGPDRECHHDRVQRGRQRIRRPLRPPRPPRRAIRPAARPQSARTTPAPACPEPLAGNSLRALLALEVEGSFRRWRYTPGTPKETNEKNGCKRSLLAHPPLQPGNARSRRSARPNTRVSCAAGRASPRHGRQVSVPVAPSLSRIRRRRPS